MTGKNSISIALVDDHVLLRRGLANLIRDLGYMVSIEASDGIEFLDMLRGHDLPDLVLLDINMPRMDGYDICLWLKQNHPDVKVLALSMFDEEEAIMRMIRNGARGYILKDSEFSELSNALDAVITRGFHYSEMITGRLIHSIHQMDDSKASHHVLDSLTPRELTFLKLAATDKTYKEIADDMSVSPRTVDGYRDDLFEKLEVKSRVGLVLFAIKNKIVNL